ncbi:UDP-N-acetylglucosamine 2-epimerase (non-hydrolysing) [Christiangramia gaetbulicola]|uniref:UDP-N-acetylglucosamine 2-epimerase (Non-hydrolysing) n=1 Tax=Christiangramia gaetbulicola TaxID=703340 RepID=A0A2T6AKY0_9FLAO|nr:UDP-N-acetylglucosamine 2-epimerase (non-hydrolyzing) [Christiangramia gaetbulicola]PTX44475.1 UDP-N-acetylglucosamine 2-epimerase (non-hydrolysing) [Christiangramia gaetbulicola]
MLKITIIAGARPNFMKIAPIIEAIQKAKSDGEEIEFRLVHTGQHYDKKMSGSFFDQLGIPEPHSNLEAGGGSQAEQTANIMIRFEKELIENPADVVLVVGDVTSTMACSITAKKLNTEVVHVEAGIRSGDLSMPEEINRMVTDSITDHFFTTSEIANENLRKAGIDEDRVHFVGNTMIDTLLANMEKFIDPDIRINGGKLREKEYFVLTLHRPANVDEEEKLKDMMQAIIDGTGYLPVIFPVHPRTAKILQNLGIEHERLHYVEPLSYLEFNFIVKNAKAVITDSGGITEETTVMGVPCLTLRDNTERPETITMGTNELVGTDPKRLKPYLDKLMAGEWKKGGEIPLWDGKTSERIIERLLNLYSNSGIQV